MMNNCHNYFSKFASVGLCLSMLSLTSCGIIEMRDAKEDVEMGESDTTMMLAPAERVNEVEVRTEEQEFVPVVEETPKTVVKFAAAGDIRIDDKIIADAANRATEGSTYSFLKIYSGIYRDIHDADLAVGGYSTAASPYACEDSAKTTPIESLAALAELGFDLLDTTGADLSDDYSEDMVEYGIDNLHTVKTGEQAIHLVEQEGVTLAFLSTDGSGKDKFVDNVRHADTVADVVVVSVSWADGASEKLKKNLAGTIAEAGADILLGFGDSLGSAEWIETADGTQTLAVYSLGNFVATAETAEELCGGVLSLDITLCEGVIALENVTVHPILMHYTEENRNYQIFEMAGYTDEIAATHAIKNLNIESAIENAGTVLESFLPADFPS